MLWRIRKCWKNKNSQTNFKWYSSIFGQPNSKLRVVSDLLWTVGNEVSVGVQMQPQVAPRMFWGTNTKYESLMCVLQTITLIYYLLFIIYCKLAILAQNER